MKDIENLYGNKSLTPIEVALEVDENGMTTAKKLYEFLELHPAHYSRWSKKNIVENVFATENVDFKPFTIDGEWGGRATTDYKLSANFAKKLCMTSKTERGEQARNYFIKVEEILAQTATGDLKLFGFNGKLCTSVRELANKYRCSHKIIQDYLQRLPLNVDYTYIMGEDLRIIKEDNGFSPTISCLYVIYQNGIAKTERFLQKQGYKPRLATSQHLNLEAK